MQRWWRNDRGVNAPAEDPALDFFEAVEAHAQAGSAMRQVRQLLAGMPEAAAHQVRGPRVEFNYDFLLFVAFQNGEAALEVLVRVEILWPDNPFGGDLRVGQARQGKGADGSAVYIVPEQVPMIVDAREVIGVNASGLPIRA
jgi:hypothetical protein